MVRGSARAVLNILADYANEEGIAWPSYPVLARESGLSERTVIRCLQKLIDNKAIEYIDGGLGRGNTTRYRVLESVKGDNVTVEKVTERHLSSGEKVTTVQIKGDNVTLKGDNVTASTYTRELEPEEPKGKPREMPAKQRVATAAEIGVNVKTLTTLTNTLLDLTGGRALADAGDDYKLRDAQDAAIILAQIGYGSVDALKELGDSWHKANAWRNTIPSIRNLKDYAGQRAASVNGSSASPSWARLNQDVPDYMKG